MGGLLDLINIGWYISNKTGEEGLEENQGHSLCSDDGASQLTLVSAKYELKCGSFPENTRNATKTGTHVPKSNEEFPGRDRKGALREEGDS